MFCPKCGMGNESRQRYCRQCGQLLTVVQLAIDGNAEESIEKYRKGSDSLIGGIAVFSIFFLISLIAYYFGGIWASAIDLVIGLMISIPMIIKGVVAVKKADRMLIEENAPRSKEIEAGRTTDKMRIEPAGGFSITEDKTLDLQPPSSKAAK